eukprot:9324959-Alexandrium_andersonii.AAC.1
MGGYRLGVKKLLGHTGGAVLTDILECETTRYTVARWERLVATNVVVSSQLWYQSHYYWIHRFCTQLASNTVASSSARRLSFEVHTIRADATNSAATRHA